ncbi:hypothetical protein AVEN_170465-1 [Araneus ventricosus]|uniref:Uncharacterized protein n=1 Tax=Araneus ventricosus TaxID=182803 RepID=A0A4Y2BYV6_ARAVE|nr:hypothetical protein AVEN_170465-1 [Araneus ventricosus]
MVHDPFGSLDPRSPCLKDVICTKRYPRHCHQQKQDRTDIHYIVGWEFTANISFRGLEVPVDNTWIVPYCPLLTKIFNEHINVRVLQFCEVYQVRL